MQKTYSIAIAGGGPAGLAAALLLCRSGHRVVVIERFAAPRAIGSGLLLQPTGLAVLDRLGLADQIIRHAAPIDRLLGIEARGRVVLASSYEDLPIPRACGFGIHRDSLFGCLYDAVLTSGIEVRSGCEVTGTVPTEGGLAVRLADGGSSEAFDLVVDATGWQTRMESNPSRTLEFGALWATLPRKAGDPFSERVLEQRYRRARQMVGVLPLGANRRSGVEELAFFWSLPVSTYQQLLDDGLQAWKAEVVALWPEASVLVARISDFQQLTLARYAHRTASRHVSHRFIRVGDAWHSASPQLGQGANMALLDVWALDRGLRHGRTLDDGLRLAAGWRRGHVGLYQAITGFFTPMYQSRYGFPPALRDRLFMPLSQYWPGKPLQARIMAGLLGNPLATLGLPTPDYDAFVSPSSSAPRTSGAPQSRSPITRQTSLPFAS